MTPLPEELLREARAIAARLDFARYAALEDGCGDYELPGESSAVIAALLDALTAQAAELAELREQVKLKSEALERVLHWAEARCPCHNEEPNPCPLCGASVENLEACKSAENTLPRDILVLLRTTAARKGGNRRTS